MRSSSEVSKANLKAYNFVAKRTELKITRRMVITYYLHYRVFKEIERFMGGFRNKRVMEIGCGAAPHLTWFSKTCISVVGLDISVGMLKLCRALWGKANIDFVVADALFLPFRNGVFDLTTVIGSAHHFPSVYKAIVEMIRVAGHVALYEPNIKSFFHRLSERLRSKFMRSSRFSNETPYNLVEYQASGFSAESISNFLQNNGLDTTITTFCIMPTSLTEKIVRISNHFLRIFTIIEDLFRKIPLLRNQLGDILVLGRKV